MKEPEEKKRAKQLRRRAEKTLSQHPERVHGKTGGDTTSYTHELEVHQIELEMQGEELRLSQGEILTSRDAYLDLYDFAPVGYFTLGRGTVISAVNLTGCRMLGVERQRLLKRPFTDFVAPAEQGAFRAYLKQCGATGSGHSSEFELVRADQASFYVQVQCLTVTSDEGKPAQFRLAVMDVTARKQAEEAVRRSQSLLAAAQHIARMGSWEWDLKTNEFHLSDEIYRIHGVDSATAVPSIESFLPLVHSDDRASVAEVIQQSVSQGKPGSVDYRVILPDGSTRYLHGEGEVSADDSGKPLRLIGTVQDITERKQGEADRETLLAQVTRQKREVEELAEVLIQERNTLQVIMENTRAHLAYLDNNFNFVQVNSTYAEGSGHTREELLGKKHFALFPNAENEVIFKEVRDTGRPVVFHDKPFEFADQPWRGVTYWDWTLSPARDATGKVQGVVLSLVETTERKKAEETLRQTRDYLQKLLDYANAPIIVWDPSGNITRFNHAFERLTGYSADEVTGRKLEVLFPPDNCEESLSKIAQAVSGAFWESVEIPILRKDGAIRIALWNSANVYAEDGTTLLATIAQGQDITARRDADDALRRERDLLRHLTEASPVGIYVVGAEGRVRFANAEAHRILGVTPELMGTIDFSRPWAGLTDFSGHVLSPEQVLFQQVKTKMNAVYGVGRIITRGNDRSLLLFNAAPLHDEREQFDGMVSVVQDVTGLVQAQEALRQSEASYRTLVDSSPDGILTLDSRGRITDANPELCRLLGYSLEEMKGQDGRRFLADTMPHDAAYYAQAIRDRLFEQELEVVRRDGRIIAVWAKLVPYYDRSGNLARIITYLRDVTEHRKLDQLKDDFIGFVSHELRTPLTVILGALNTILSEEAKLSTAERRALMEDAVWGAETLGRILENLLELTRARAKKLMLCTEPIDLSKVVESAVAKIKSQMGKGHRVVIDLPADLPPVPADALRVERILHNLLDNAVKYSPQGGDVRVFARRDGKQVVVGVSDQGIGISTEDQARLFASFERVESLVSGIKGVGLGLAVCRYLVEAHQGKLWVESQPGQGATFYFTLPLGGAPNIR